MDKTRTASRGGRGRRQVAWALWLAVAGAGLAGVGGGGCAREPVAPFDPRQVGLAERRAAKDAPLTPMGELSTQYQDWRGRREREENPPPPPPPGRVLTGEERRVPLTLEQVIQRVVANNLDVKVASVQPAVEATRVLEAQARFDPTLFGTLGAEVTNRTTAGSVIPDPNNNFSTIISDRQRQVQYTGATGIRQILEGGGQIEARYQLRRTDLNPSTFLIDPYSEADLVLQLTQPLLRDFGGQVNRARIDIARNNQRVSVLEFRNAVEEAVAKAEQVYWQLVAAQLQVGNAERLLERTIRTADILQQRLANDATRLDLTQAQADAEIRRSVLVRAQARVRDLSDQLKQLMNDPELPVAGPELIVAESRPLEQPVRFDLAELLETASVNRAELSQQQLRINNASITLEAAKNNLLPSLNFVGSVNPSGLATTFDRAISSQADFNRISYSLGLQMEIPLGNREARAIYRRSLLQRTQAMTQYASLVSQVTLDVKTRLREVETTWQELVNARAAKFAQEQSLRAIQVQEDTGQPLTPFFVRNKLDTQARLAEAEAQEYAALANYNVAISQLERAKGTLLRYNNITLDERGTGRTRNGR
ncbi:MAG: TolC family protein [Tepidisphaerales bacterium]